MSHLIEKNEAVMGMGLENGEVTFYAVTNWDTEIDVGDLVNLKEGDYCAAKGPITLDDQIMLMYAIREIPQRGQIFEVTQKTPTSMDLVFPLLREKLLHVEIIDGGKNILITEESMQNFER